MSEMESRVLALASRLGLSDDASRELIALVSEIRDGESSGVSRERPGVIRRTYTTGGPEGEAAGAPISAIPILLPETHGDPRPLGVGGMGEVFLVRDRALNRSVALKAIRGKLAGKPANLKRFLREAQITAQLQHPGVVPVYELGELGDGRPYFTMKEVRGRTLGSLIKAVHEASAPGQWNGVDGWTLRRLVEAFQRVCETVAFCHSRRVVHRDLKPSNIMLGDYGEVLVLDWGIAKVIGDSEDQEPGSPAERIEVTDGHATRAGAVTGTPAYMAPEQARGSHDEVGPATDVYALGAVLYEILYNRPPYSLSEASTREALPAGPVAPIPAGVLDLAGRLPVPRELQAICLRALATEPRDRYPQAGPLAAEVSAWLEGAKNLAVARQVLGQAERQLEEVRELRRRAGSERAKAQQILGQIPGFAPVEAKREGWAIDDRAHALEREADLKGIAFTQVVRAALTHHADLPEAHALLADHYAWEHRQAEARGDQVDAARLEVLLRDHDRGAHAAYLSGEGALTLATDPAGAATELFRYVLEDRRLQLQRVGSLGPTPIRAHPLPMGSYLLVLRAEGRQEVRYPLQIRRNEHWDGVPPEADATEPVYLPRAGEIAADECYVPAGWFWAGGEAGLGKRSVIPRRRMWLDGFAVRRHHVTIAEYVQFLNALVAAGREEEAMTVAPRAAGQGQQPGPLLLDRNASGQFEIPPNNFFNIPWQPNWPIIFVDWYGANAYLRWRAETSGQPYRLIWELEWEKAARGVDGRRYPWGEFLDPTWARMLETHAALPTMADAGTYEVDESPYGVRDMAGNQRDWCLDIPSEAEPPATAAGRVLGPRESHEWWNLHVARGGNFVDAPLWCWSYFRSSFLPIHRDFTVSFRTCRPIGRK